MAVLPPAGGAGDRPHPRDGVPLPDGETEEQERVAVPRGVARAVLGVHADRHLHLHRPCGCAAPVLQPPPEGTGDDGEKHVIDGHLRSDGLAERVQLVQPALREGSDAVGTDLTGQRGQPPDPTELADHQPAVAEHAREPRPRGDVRGCSRRRRTSLPGNRRGPALLSPHQPWSGAHDGDPVGEAVVDLPDQGRAAVREPRDDVDPPQRPTSVERRHHDLRNAACQRDVIDRSLGRPDTDVPADVELRVLLPGQPRGRLGCRDEPLRPVTLTLQPVGHLGAELCHGQLAVCGPEYQHLQGVAADRAGLEREDPGVVHPQGCPGRVRGHGELPRRGEHAPLRDQDAGADVQGLVGGTFRRVTRALRVEDTGPASVLREAVAVRNRGQTSGEKEAAGRAWCPNLRLCLWAGAGSNRRPSTFQADARTN